MIRLDTTLSYEAQVHASIREDRGVYALVGRVARETPAPKPSRSLGALFRYPTTMLSFRWGARTREGGGALTRPAEAEKD